MKCNFGVWRCGTSTIVDIRRLEVNDLYSLNKIDTNEMEGHVERMGKRRGVYMVLVGKPEGKRLLGRSRLRWEENIKMDLHELGFRTWTGSSWLRIGTGGEYL